MLSSVPRKQGCEAGWEGWGDRHSPQIGWSINSLLPQQLGRGEHPPHWEGAVPGTGVGPASDLLEPRHVAQELALELCRD